MTELDREAGDVGRGSEDELGSGTSGTTGEGELCRWSPGQPDAIHPRFGEGHESASVALAAGDRAGWVEWRAGDFLTVEGDRHSGVVGQHRSIRGGI